MTETEWLTCARTEPMLRHLSQQQSGWWSRFRWWGKDQSAPARGRKLRLFAAACCRRLPVLMKQPTLRQVVEASVAFADGGGSWTEVQKALAAAQEDYEREMAGDPTASRVLRRTGSLIAAQACSFEVCGERLDWSEGAVSCARLVVEQAALASVGPGVDLVKEVKAQADTMRHVFGNPFRKTNVSDLPRGMVHLARAVDAGAAGADAKFGAALRAAGREDLALHFGSNQEHPRGCWLVDLVLGKG